MHFVFKNYFFMYKIKINQLYSCISIIAIIMALLATACTSDQLPEPTPTDCTTLTPTYTVDIQPIIEQSCAFSGCHLDSAPGNYDSYDGLLAVLENGKFRQRVITDRSDEVKGMPPNFTPDDRPKDLTEQEIELIDCWLIAGFPE